MDYESNPYELATRDQLEAANDSIFHVECHNQDSNSLQVEVCFLLFLFLLYYIRLLFFFRFCFA